MKNNILIIVILVIIIGVGGFFAGMKYQQSKQPSRADFQTRMEMRQGIPGNRQHEGSEAVRGEIIDKDEESIIVKLPDDSSKIVLISENTTINKATEGSVNDLKNGEQVMVFGKGNSDGSVSAQNIQLNPGFSRSPN